jgi:hypothetical protein
MLTKESKEDLPLEVYKRNKTFQEIVKRKYNIKDQGILYDDKILLLIYACEWFDIPNRKIYEKVCYHPLLTKRHHKKLNVIYENQKNNLYMFIIPLYGFLYILKKKFAKGFNPRKHYKILFSIYGSGIVAPFLMWKYILSKKMNEDIRNDNDLNQYLFLNFDRDKIKKDLLNYNIVL